jgi:hypothetical protein
MFPIPERHLRETGSLSPNKHSCGHLRKRCTPDFEAVIPYFEEQPDTTTQSIAQALGVNHMSEWQVLHDENLHPYHLQKVQTMRLNDFALRVKFCRWLLRKTIQVPHFLYFIFFSDERTFTKDGIFNSRNSHVCAQENPNTKHMQSHQHRFTVNVWAEIIDDHLISPYLIPLRLTDDIYLTFLQKTLPELLEVVPLEVCREM